MKGFKAVRANGRAKHGSEVFEVGKTYLADGPIKLCESGYHFCEKCADVFAFYDFNPSETRVLEVEAAGSVVTDGVKSCTDELRIVRELTWAEVLDASNGGRGNSGYGNSGDRNSGDWNSGDWNSGDWNSGFRNSGYGNSGDWNSGFRNSGDWNSGDWNSGDRNSGDRNSGDRNSGDWNCTNFSSGVLCTEEPECLIFDEPSGMTLREWRKTEAAALMRRVPSGINEWVEAADMTDTEKAANPSWETCGGYLRRGPYEPDFAGWWAELTDGERAVIRAIPNFDAAKWKAITGIEVGA